MYTCKDHCHRVTTQLQLVIIIIIIIIIYYFSGDYTIRKNLSYIEWQIWHTLRVLVHKRQPWNQCLGNNFLIICNLTSHLICKCFATLFSFHAYCYVSEVLYKSERKKLKAVGIQTFEGCKVFRIFNVQGGSNMTGTDLRVNKPHCAAAVRPWESEATTSTLPPTRVRTCSVLSGSC